MAQKKTEKSDAKTPATSTISKDEQIGYHKGSLSVLDKERQELSRILGIIEQLMQMHASALRELGVTNEQPKADSVPAAPQKSKPPIEDIL